MFSLCLYVCLSTLIYLFPVFQKAQCCKWLALIILLQNLSYSYETLLENQPYSFEGKRGSKCNLLYSRQKLQDRLKKRAIGQTCSRTVPGRKTSTMSILKITEILEYSHKIRIWSKLAILHSEFPLKKCGNPIL